MTNEPNGLQIRPTTLEDIDAVANLYRRVARVPGGLARLEDEVTDRRPAITRVELIARESNDKAIRFYESLGFEREGLFRGRIRNADGSREADVPMGWMRSKP